MTSGPDPPRVIYGDPFTPGSAKLVEPWRGLGHLWLLGIPIARAVSDDLLIAPLPTGGRSRRRGLT